MVSPVQVGVSNQTYRTIAGDHLDQNLHHAEGHDLQPPWKVPWSGSWNWVHPPGRGADRLAGDPPRSLTATGSNPIRHEGGYFPDDPGSKEIQMNEKTTSTRGRAAVSGRSKPAGRRGIAARSEAIIASKKPTARRGRKTAAETRIWRWHPSST